MSSAQHAAIINRILVEQQVSKLDAEPDTRRLELYKLALGEIKERLESHVPREIPFETLQESEEALNEISVAFCYLAMKPSGKKYKLEEIVQPKVDEALVFIQRALILIEEYEQKNTEYLQCVTRLRRIMIQIYEYLR